ncbi:type IIL restriction-modification enzyme MmeI [Deinococcus pimensis]|uniref:type IIL restriction-modification enzyme MmeI n=1 Tax=Deinococcus pimensis TaxID=309888 RepID=UPI000482D802|nr:type IIL restriction-modification enzyme MmeI [Deinococcus pimensis]
MVRRGVNAGETAHFLMRVAFALFSEDTGLLDRGVVEHLLKRAQVYPERTQQYFAEQFAAMRDGGEFWGTDVRHFNGGLFNTHDALALAPEEINALAAASKLDWAEVEPSNRAANRRTSASISSTRTANPA